MKSKAMPETKRAKLQAELAGEHLREKLIEFINSRKFTDLPEVYLKFFPENIHIRTIKEWQGQRQLLQT